MMKLCNRPRILVLGSLLLYLLGQNTTIAGETFDSKPNIIFILADDLGYGDLGCFGQQRIKTPYLDRMASEGMRLTSFYSGSTVCAPSRCVLMTGFHTGHCLIRGNGRMPLRPEDITIAEVMQEAGYRTCLSGKWGLGEAGSTGIPNKQGFDEFFGYLNQRHAHNYYPEFLVKNQSKHPLENVVPPGSKVGEGKATVKNQYSHDLIINHAIDFIENNATSPFFLYLALTIPHANNEAGKAGMEVPELGEYATRDWPGPQKGHAAMITRMDRDCGRILDLLKRLGIDDQTLVIFSSDNGPHREGGNNPEFNKSSGPLTGIKRSLHEGGIRVPTIARWPGKIPAGSTCDFAGGFQDLMPTFAELADAKDHCPADIDGISILPSLFGKPTDQPDHEMLFWAFYERGGGRAGRSGRWKIIQQPINSSPRLYDLESDIGETVDLREKRPEVFAQMLVGLDRQYTPTPDWQFPKQNRKKQRQKKK